MFCILKHRRIKLLRRSYNVNLFFLGSRKSMNHCGHLSNLWPYYVPRGLVLHWPSAHLLFHFWVYVLIENFMLNKEITLFFVWKPLFTWNLTFYVLADLNLIYLPTYSMYLFSCVAFSYFSSTNNEKHYGINILALSGEIC